MYQIIRIFYKGEIESHSIDTRESWRDALARFYSIVAADLSNPEVTYCYTVLLDEEGKVAMPYFKYNTIKDAEGNDVSPFNCAIARVRIKNGERSTSVEYKNYSEAMKRYFNILAADLQDEEVTYNMAVIINANGDIIEHRAFF